MRAPRPAAAAAPCTRFELLTPRAVHLPRRRPPARVFLVTTAKSGPGIRTRTTANARNSAYFDHDMTGSASCPGTDIPRLFPEACVGRVTWVYGKRGVVGAARGPRPVHRGGRGAAASRTARTPCGGGRRRRSDQAGRGQHRVLRGQGARRALRAAAADGG